MLLIKMGMRDMLLRKNANRFFFDLEESEKYGFNQWWEKQKVNKGNE